MSTPTVPVPAIVEKWISRSGYLRWVDALAAWLIIFFVAVQNMPRQSGRTVAVASVSLLLLCLLLSPLRLRWRPISGWIGLVVSRSLRPGDRAWFIRHGHADPVLITGRRRWILAIGGPNIGEAETITVRRTRVFLVPFDTGR
jgi:hypothetical protein